MARQRTCLSTHCIAQGLGGLDAAFLVNRLPLPVATLSVKPPSALESPDDLNTAYGFAAAQLGERSPMLTCNPLGTTVAVRNTLSQIASYTQYPGIIRCGSAIRRAATTNSSCVSGELTWPN